MLEVNGCGVGIWCLADGLAGLHVDGGTVDNVKMIFR